MTGVNEVDAPLSMAVFPSIVSHSDPLFYIYMCVCVCVCVCFPTGGKPDDITVLLSIVAEYTD